MVRAEGTSSARMHSKARKKAEKYFRFKPGEGMRS
jgi:hypothetical protein